MGTGCAEIDSRMKRKEGKRMKCQIAYMGRIGNAPRIARAIAEILPSNYCSIIDMEKLTPDKDSDTYIFCFDLKNDACPFVVLDFIEELEGKTILMIGISAIGTDEKYRAHLESQITPFLPDHCQYRGTYLCKGRMTQEEMMYISSRADEKGTSLDREKLMKLYEESQSHPDMMDLHNVLQFVSRQITI